MTDPNDKLRRAYRGLANEEPPASLDAAILARARERVVPRRKTSWMVPVSIAAVLVLGIGVSLRMQMEEPGIETSVPEPASAPEAKPKLQAPVTNTAPATAEAPPAAAAPPIPEKRVIVPKVKERTAAPPIEMNVAPAQPAVDAMSRRD